MKNLIFVLALCAPVAGWSQMMNGMDLGQMDGLKYMEVVVNKPPFYKGYFAYADFGQGVKVGDHGFQEDGKDKIFKSEMHVLNWLWVKGWDLVRDWKDGDARHFVVERAEEKR